MDVTTIVAQKIDQSQRFLENGNRVPVSLLSVPKSRITQIKVQEKEGYTAIQIGLGTAKKANKATVGHGKKAGASETPRFLKEIRVENTDGAQVGGSLNVIEIFKPGDIVSVTGKSKGKGYAGVVKRHHFKGGPKTHGQSDRERAPGSIGQTTTPGRVYKGKRMSGRMGNSESTVRRLTVLSVDNESLIVSGLIPGVRGSYVVIKKIGENKKYTPLLLNTDEAIAVEEVVVEEGEEKEEAKEAASDKADETKKAQDGKEANIAVEDNKKVDENEKKASKAKEEVTKGSSAAKAMEDKKENK